MPSNFGRVFRAGISSNPINPLATQLFIISRDSTGKLIVSPDTLKKNIRIYLNQYRMISDAIDILDSPVINLGIDFRIVVEANAVKNIVLQGIQGRLKKFFDIKNFQINQPVKIDDIQNIIFNSPGVASVLSIKFKNITGTVLGREYSDVKFDINSNTRKRHIIPPAGGIFEVRYPDFDYVGSAV